MQDLIPLFIAILSNYTDLMYASLKFVIFDQDSLAGNLLHGSNLREINITKK
jgi:hypothetical protein